MDTMNAVSSPRPTVPHRCSSAHSPLLAAASGSRPCAPRRRPALVLVVGGLLLAGLLGCTSESRTPEPLDDKERECREVVSRILRIQAERDRRSDDLNQMIDEVEKWEAGQGDDPPKLSQKEQKKMIQEWREHENRLRNEVSALYITSERKGCL